MREGHESTRDSQATSVPQAASTPSLQSISEGLLMTIVDEGLLMPASPRPWPWRPRARRGGPPRRVRAGLGVGPRGAAGSPPWWAQAQGSRGQRPPRRPCARGGRHWRARGLEGGERREGYRGSGSGRGGTGRRQRSGSRQGWCTLFGAGLTGLEDLHVANGHAARLAARGGLRVLHKSKEWSRSEMRFCMV